MPILLLAVGEERNLRGFATNSGNFSVENILLVCNDILKRILFDQGLIYVERFPKYNVNYESIGTKTLFCVSDTDNIVKRCFTSMRDLNPRDCNLQTELRRILDYSLDVFSIDLQTGEDFATGAGENIQSIIERGNKISANDNLSINLGENVYLQSLTTRQDKCSKVTIPLIVVGIILSFVILIVLVLVFL